MAALRSAILGDMLEGMRAHAARSLLIFGAVTLGAFALTVLLSVSHGLELRTDALVRQLGERTFVVLGDKFPSTGPALRLQPDMASMLRADMGNIDTSVVRNDVATVPGFPEPVQVIATDERLAGVRGWKLTAGRFLDQGDVVHAERELVVAESLSQAWNLQVRDIFTLGRTPFTIVGIVATPQSSLEAQVLARDIVVPDHSVFVPYSVEPDWIAGGSSAPVGVDAIYVQSREQVDISGALASVTNLLSQAGLSTAHLQWVTPASLSVGLKRLKDMVVVTAGGVAVLSMLLGGITLASLMLANVRDRVVEIGLRRAFGARSRDIVQLFILEALCITLAASVLGSAIAVVVLLLAGPLPLPASPDAYSVLVPLGFGLGLGALSAWWPARLAARIQPAQALRSA
ncbi:MAG TPA: ABC transporter permease [Gammaproteobacteria bacterium]|jgi:putative ABC transport system permease protein|nr:ABC transporter permease [Gammaproteobacteria bacterium]